MDVSVGLWRKLSAEELMLLNCGVGKDSWESPGLQGDQTSPPKGDQSWVFIRKTDAEAETPILWPPHVKSWLIGKDPDAGRNWGQEEKGMTENEMAGWHHRLEVWVDSRSSWWTGRPGVLWFMGLQRVGHNWATELINASETPWVNLEVNDVPLLLCYDLDGPKLGMISWRSFLLLLFVCF